MAGVLHRGPGLAGILLIIILLGMRILTEGPTVVPASAEGSEFSADRAYETLTELLEGIGAHPSGSDANKLLRARIVTQLNALGLSAEIQKDFQCSTLAPGCSFVENVIAVLPGSAPGGLALLATAHYDSAPAAGGAADDGAGVAVLLEAIKAVQATGPIKNDVVFLFSDAEESGLRGAMAFNQKHPLMDRVGMILNMEARGVAGPSVMFETGPENYSQVKGYARSTPRPVGNSLIVEVYKRMPNGTDLMAYGERGLPALNFAFTRGVSLYHSPHDTVENLSKKSLQHHGDHMLSAIQHFGNADLGAQQHDGNAVYIDLFGLVVLMWPESMSIWLSGAALLGLVVAAVTIRPRFTKIVWSCGLVLVSVTCVLAAGWLLSFPLSNWGDLHPLDHPYPWPGRLALIAAALIVPVGAVRLCATRLDAESLFHVVWWLFLLISIALCFTVPGAAYLFLLPVFVAALVAALCRFWQPEKSVMLASWAGLLVAAYMAFYHFILMEVVFNFHLSHFKMIPLILLSLALMPLWAHWQKNGEIKWGTSGLALALGAATIIGNFVPAYTQERPRSTNIIYRNVTEGTQHWQLYTYGPEDKAYLQKAGFGLEKKAYDNFGYKPLEGYLKPAEDLGIGAPEITVLSDEINGETRVIEAVVKFDAKAMVSGVGFHPDTKLLSLEAAGQLVLETPEPAAHALFMGSNPAGLPLIITVTAESPVEIRLFDLTPLSLVGEAAALARLRPDDTAPMHFGDHSVVSRTVRIGE